MDNFKELQSYQPDYYRDILEMVAINQANGNQLNLLESEIIRLKDNAIPSTMQLEGVERWERILGLNQSNKALNIRKAVILAKLRGIRKLSGSKIIEILKEFQNGDIEFSFIPTNGMMVIEYIDHQNGISGIGSFAQVLEELKPAKLDWLIELGKIFTIGVFITFEETQIPSRFVNQVYSGGGEFGI